MEGSLSERKQRVREVRHSGLQLQHPVLRKWISVLSKKESRTPCPPALRPHYARVAFQS